MFREKPSDCRACRMIMLPMCSTASGCSSRVDTVASIASSMLEKWRTASPLLPGTGTRFKRALVTAANVPSEPTMSRERL